MHSIHTKQLETNSVRMWKKQLLRHRGTAGSPQRKEKTQEQFRSLSGGTSQAQFLIPHFYISILSPFSDDFKECEILRKL